LVSSHNDAGTALFPLQGDHAIIQSKSQINPTEIALRKYEISMSSPAANFDIPYVAPLLGNIRQILTGLQGFSSMALELIQNADDAKATHIRFDVKDDELCVWNNGAFSSCGLTEAKCPWESKGGPDGRRKACDFHAISMVGSGNKYRDPSVIGRFGIGFVSVYQITDSPVIRSSYVQLKLDPLNEKSHISRIKPIDGSEFVLSWAFDPDSPTREALYASPVQHSDLNTISDDIQRISRSALLFLRNLVSIEANRNGHSIFSVRRTGSDRVNLEFKNDSERERWYIVDADATEPARQLRQKYPTIDKLCPSTDVRIAFCLDQKKGRVGKFFAYLPTEQDAPVPCHINADFFPEQDRKAIILSGEQHERHWNQMLLNVAANEIGNKLLELRDVLGPRAVWQLLSEALDRRTSEQFGRFWTAIHETAAKSAIVWSGSEQWMLPASCRLPSPDITTEEELALRVIGIDLVHPDLRQYQNALLAVGIERVTFATLVDALDSWFAAKHDPATKSRLTQSHIVSLQRLVERTVPKDFAANKPSLPLVARLKTIPFIPKWPNGLAAIDDLYRLPSGISHKQISQFIDLPLAGERFYELSSLFGLTDVLSFDSFVRELVELIPDQDSALAVLGEDPKRLRSFYRFLSVFPRDDHSPHVISLSQTPILRGRDRFLTPREARLPGGFTDPIGRFDTLDISLYDDRAQEFLKEALGVRVLTLETYIRSHLADILAKGVTANEYLGLLDELTKHPQILEDATSRDILKKLPIVRTEDSGMARPSECYFKSQALVEILGDQKHLWVDISLFPSFKGAIVKAFLERLGMRSRPTLAHAVDRVEAVVKDRPTERAQETISVLISFIFQLFEQDSIADHESFFANEIRRMRNAKWLPGSIGGKINTEEWYAPNELYQPFRAFGFDTQVSTLALKLSQRTPLTSKFLEFLGMPAEPATTTVVAHLIFCSQSELKPNDLTYQILNERVLAKDSLGSVARLKDIACIYSTAQKRFVSGARIFWSKPPIPRYCFQAPEWMHRYRPFFEIIGVNEEPSDRTYAGVIVDITKEFAHSSQRLSKETQLIHGICLAALAGAIEDDQSQGESIINSLIEQPFLITLSETLAFAEEVVICDNEWLAEPFGGELNSRLIKVHPEHRAVIDRLNLRALSAVTRLEAVRLGELIVDDSASRRIAERHVLLLWMFSGLKAKVRQEASSALAAIEIMRSDFIQSRSVFSPSDTPIVSTPRGERVLFERGTHKLYLHVDLGEAFWIPALRAIFSTLLAGEDGIDIRQCALTGSHILAAPTFDHARIELEQAGFEPPSDVEQPDFEGDGTGLGDISVGGGRDDSIFEETATGDMQRDNINDAGDADKSHAGSMGSGSGHDGSAEHNESDGTVSSGKGDARNAAPAGIAGQKDNGQDDTVSNGGDKRRQHASTERSTRTQWMRSYVVPEQGSKERKEMLPLDQTERNAAIDEAAMIAVIGYEESRRCKVERMPHLNPGHDIISRSSDTSEKRIIEVKGLEGEWTERGVKLTRTQIMNAEEYGDEFWLYVVERALDPQGGKIHAIQNPFFKASEFWFDYIWREIANETGDAMTTLFAPGRKIKVQDWEVGTIVDIVLRGIASRITIDFPNYGRKHLAFNPTTMEPVDD
jgi:hypothetical protein